MGESPGQSKIGKARGATTPLTLPPSAAQVKAGAGDRAREEREGGRGGWEREREREEGGAFRAERRQRTDVGPAS